MTEESRIVVATAVDETYLKPLAVMLASLSARIDPCRRATVYLLDGTVGDGNREKIARSLQSDTVELRWVPVPRSDLADLPAGGRVSPATYYRLLLGESLPPSVGRVVWLDSDLVVNADLGGLWSIPMGGFCVRAVQDMIVPDVSHHGRSDALIHCGMRHEAKYFNAGVMLIDLDRWRRDDVPARVRACIRSLGSEILYWDQDGLNAVLRGRWGELDPRWNLNAGVAGRSFYDPVHLDVETYRRLVADPWIVHFCGRLKPWKLHDVAEPYGRLFFDYLDRTPWAGWRPPRTLWSSIVSLYETSRLRDWIYRAEKPTHDWIQTRRTR